METKEQYEQRRRRDVFTGLGRAVIAMIAIGIIFLMLTLSR